jgi:T5SS/PEP-CTERM-associated repeat protein
MQVGLGGAGTFNQNGGSVAAQGVTLGVASGSTGTYALTGGTIGGLSDPSLGGPFVAIVVGEAGGGAFTQDGGEVLASSLVLGRQAGATGTYGVSNGRLDVRGSVVVGDSGTGQLDVSGGQSSVDGNVVVAAQAGSTGTLKVSGGFLGAANININAGGTLNYSGGQIDLYPDQFGTLGSLVNGIGGEVYISGTSVITGNVANDGKIKVTDATVFYTGTYAGSGVYESDPSFNYFMSDLVLTKTGYLVGGSGDVFQIGGGFLNASTNAAQWNADLASLVFSGVGDHRFGVAAGVGALAFGWGGIRTDLGVRLSFYDSVVTNNGMALCVGILELADGLNAILLDPGELLTIYFDRSKRENAYLLAALENQSGLPKGLTLVAYGAPIAAVPEAPTLPLLALGLAGIAMVRRQRPRA